MSSKKHSSKIKLQDIEDEPLETNYEPDGTCQMLMYFKECSRKMYMYSVKSNNWLVQKLDILDPIPMYHSSCVSNDGGCFLSGGTRNGEVALEDLFEYNGEALSLDRLPSLNQKRMNHCLIAIDEIDCLLTVGGCDGRFPLASVEKFSLKSSKWRPVPSLIYSRIGPKSCKFSDSIDTTCISVIVAGGVKNLLGAPEFVPQLEIIRIRNGKFDPQWTLINTEFQCKCINPGIDQVDHNQIIIYGGDGYNNGLLKTVVYLDMQNFQSSKTDLLLPSGSEFLSNAALYEDKLFAVATRYRKFSAMVTFNYQLKTQWKKLKSQGSESSGCSCTLL